MLISLFQFSYSESLLSIGGHLEDAILYALLPVLDVGTTCLTFHKQLKTQIQHGSPSTWPPGVFSLNQQWLPPGEPPLDQQCKQWLPPANHHQSNTAQSFSFLSLTLLLNTKLKVHKTHDEGHFINIQ